MTKIAAISSHHKTHQNLHQELETAKQQVTINATYSHYKHPENTYKVINLGFIEASDEICVIYQAMYDKKLVFVRPLSSWLEKPQWQGSKVARFERVE